MVQFTFTILFSLDRCLASLSSYVRFVFICSLLGQELLLKKNNNKFRQEFFKIIGFFLNATYLLPG
jgi:hypothetical protein